jgi:RNase E specificity factor CsrD
MLNGKPPSATPEPTAPFTAPLSTAEITVPSLKQPGITLHLVYVDPGTISARCRYRPRCQESSVVDDFSFAVRWIRRQLAGQELDQCFDGHGERGPQVRGGL